MIRGLGCDVCAISRMQNILENPRFLERWFTAYERDYIAARKNAAQTAAGLFAAKEAFVKALGTGFAGLTPDKVSVRHDANGAPCYELNEAMTAAMARKGASLAHLSVSHDGDVAMAVAILEGTT
ncbi:MAG: holo-ACP synthase [Clostridia bacterium]|nr:holo-ACP synthase [Clostridia bacterium]